MPFDPDYPQNGTPLDADPMRAQLNGLHDLIVPGPTGPQGIPGPPGVAGAQGIQGEPGEQGPPFAGVVVDGVTTLPPGDPATVTANLSAGNVHLLFALPSGANGTDGAPGLPFAIAEVETVTTLPAGSPATATAVLDGDVVRLSFGLPQGANGADGTNGTNGSDGGNGADGAPRRGDGSATRCRHRRHLGEHERRRHPRHPDGRPGFGSAAGEVQRAAPRAAAVGGLDRQVDR